MRAANRTGRPEEDTGLRVAVAAAVGVSVLAVGVTGAVPVSDVAVISPLLAAGFTWSHARRAADNSAMKGLLALGALLALWRFFGDVRLSASLDDTRQPLAQLFLAVQVLHAFDVPARRDLGFSLASSLTLVALAGTATAGLPFGFVLALYVGIAAWASAGLQRSFARERAEVLSPGRLFTPASEVGAPTLAVRGPALRTAAAAVPLLVAAGLVFSLLPTTGRARLAGLPFSPLPGAVLPDAGVVNPALPFAGLQAGGEGGGGEASGYFGFAEYMDLRTAGRPSDDPVLRVRVDQPRLLRGIVFDTYDGRSWQRSSSQPEAFSGPPVDLAPPPAAGVQRRQVTTTVELLAETPNLFFAPADALRVWSAGSVAQWDDGTLTTGATHGAGTVYSVVSQIDVTPAERLREVTSSPGALSEADRARYLQLPATLPARIRDLAEDLTAGVDTPYERAEAVQAWLAGRVEYTLGEPPPPDDADVVDHLLFSSRRGWCEPIATSMTVLLRAAGVPARVATGFQPGTRQPITGWWTVQASEAHAWSEVWVPGHGWVAFDPTGAVPLALDPDPPAPRPPLLAALSWLRERVAVPPVDGGTVAVALGALLGAAALGVAALAALRPALRERALARLRRRAPSPPFARLLRLLAQRGLPAEPWRTPREVAAAAGLARSDLPRDALATLVQEEEARRYAPAAHHPQMTADAERALRQLSDTLRR